LTTDIIVGFPGETDQEFEETMAFVEQIKFSEIHVFQFSKREGTPAATMPDQVDQKFKKARSEKLIELASDLGKRYKAQFIGETIEILMEERKENECIGHSKNYLKISVIDPEHKGIQGKVYNVIIKEILDEKIFGEFA
jgi:threonylcarbamoyladenosine tRNA methylthiotransferase MtaB